MTYFDFQDLEHEKAGFRRPAACVAGWVLGRDTSRGVACKGSLGCAAREQEHDANERHRRFYAAQRRRAQALADL